MVENNTNTDKPNQGNLEKILQERERLNQILQQEFKKEVTILFTDICGYTEYTDRMGDISGRTLLLKHNNIVRPIVEKHDGKVIEIIGDAIMAVFSSALAAVKASVSIQRSINENNKKTEAGDRFHLKIGIATGHALVDESADYQGFAGDVANIAARIQSQANSDQILLSKAVYDQVGGSEDILCRFHDTIQVKGKTHPLEIYRVVWQDEYISLNRKPRLRPHETVAPGEDRLPLKQIQLEIARAGNRLKLSAHEQLPGEESTIRHYEEIPASLDLIETKCCEIVDVLNKANRKGIMSREALVKLRETGQVLHDELFTLNIKEKLATTKAEYLRLKIDDHLVHLPWELLNDGRQFLCQRFNVGRLVKTRQLVLGVNNRMIARPLRMLILADPEGDLIAAYKEGTQIRDYMDRNRELINASLRSGHITLNSLRESIRNFDFVHFAGHSDYNQINPGESGWRLTGGSLKARDITKMIGTASMPALIFSNACQSARTEEWFLKVHFEDEIFGLANAFLLAGVKHYLGTFWEISDEPSSQFALEFYKNLLSGMTIGEALRQSRLTLVKEFGEENIVWASYVLYGDPTTNYIEEMEGIENKPETEPAFIPSSDAEIRTREAAFGFAEKKVKKIKWFSWFVVTGIVILLGLMLWGYLGGLKNKAAEYEKAAWAFYHEGNFKEALNVCEILEDKLPGGRLFHLIRGNIHLINGKPDAAEASYNKALQSPNGTDLQKAGALNGLGRIASLQEKSELALKYYRQATEAAPENVAGYLSQGVLLEDKGDYDEALNFFNKAHALSPRDQTITAITEETRKKVLFERDQKKQERIDRLIKELLDGMKSPSRAITSDEWTSPPLTVWLMDLKASGYSLKEGIERLLLSGITDQLLQHSQARLVERALFDKLIEELKLGSSKLIDRKTELSLGKLMAAKLIISGQVIHAGPQVQVSMRLIETETGQITAAINQLFGSTVPISLLSEKLSKELMAKFIYLYPLRGKILELNGETIKINVGEIAKVRIGQYFNVVDEDATLEVISVLRETSLTRIVGEKVPLQKGMRVEQIK